MRRYTLGSLAMLCLLLVNATALTPRFAFVANSSDGTVSVYTVNATSGLLRTDGYAVVKSNPQGLAVTPGGQFLYVANTGSADVSAISVNTQNGTLTTIAGSPFAAGTSPSAAVTDPAGKFLYIANKGSANVSAFKINATTGVITPVTGSPFAAETSPGALEVDPSGKFLYVAKRFGYRVGLQDQQHHGRADRDLWLAVCHRDHTGGT